MAHTLERFDVVEWRPVVRQWCRHRARSIPEAEDLEQDVLLTALRYFSSFRGDCSLRSWLFRITLQCARRQRDANDCAVTSLETLAQDPVQSDLSELIINRIAIRSALERLPGPSRDALLLVKGHGLTHADAAIQLGVPAGTVRRRVCYALRQLRAWLEEGGA